MISDLLITGRDGSQPHLNKTCTCSTTLSVPCTSPITPYNCRELAIAHFQYLTLPGHSDDSPKLRHPLAETVGSELGPKCRGAVEPASPREAGGADLASPTFSQLPHQGPQTPRHLGSLRSQEIQEHHSH